MTQLDAHHERIATAHPYQAQNGGIVRVAMEGKRLVVERLTNFTARIVREVVRESGDDVVDRLVWLP